MAILTYDQVYDEVRRDIEGDTRKDFWESWFRLNDKQKENVLNTIKQHEVDLWNEVAGDG